MAYQVTHDFLRRIAQMRFRAENPLSLKEIVEELRKTREIPPAPKPGRPKEETRRVSNWLDQAVRWLLEVEEEYTASQETPVGIYEPAEDFLMFNFGLVHAAIAPDNYLAQFAGQYVSSLLHESNQRELATDLNERETVNLMIDGGLMVNRAVSFIRSSKFQPVNLYPSAIYGEECLNESNWEPSPEANIMSCTIRLHGQPHYATISSHDFIPTEVPRGASHKRLIGELVEINKLLARENPYKKLLAKVRQTNIAILGFGGLGGHTASHFSKALSSYRLNIDLLRKQEGIIGSLGYCPLDASGNTKDEWQWFLSAGYPDPPELFREIQGRGGRVIGIGGIDNYTQIKAALNKRLINVLITDKRVAKELWNEYGPRPDEEYGIDPDD